MKIIIRDNKVKLTIPVPMFLISDGKKLTKFIQKHLIKNDTSKKNIDILNSLDMDVILLTLKELKGYKDLHLVEIKGKDGRYILIKM